MVSLWVAILTGAWMNDKGDSASDDVNQKEVRDRHERLSEDVDSILDEIDEVMEENAEEFVRSYVHKGGQGWSGFFTPEFYVGAAAAGVLSGATYDVFKAVIRRIATALLQVPGRRSIHTQDEYEDALRSGWEDQIIEGAWETARRLVKQQDIQHSIDEATALHWVLFTRELGRSLGSVHLGAKRHERLARIGASFEDPLNASRLAARIIDQWLEQKEPHIRLRKAREEEGLTQEAVGQELEWSLSKVIRIESGLESVSAKDLTALLRLYRIDDPQLINELTALSKARRKLGKGRQRET
jgi:ubiquitin-like protein Pup